MRWQEFKCNLLETKQQEQVIVKKAETHLDALVNGAKELPDTDPAKQKVINTYYTTIDKADQSKLTATISLR